MQSPYDLWLYHSMRFIIDRLEFHATALVAKDSQDIQPRVFGFEFFAEENLAAAFLAFYRHISPDTPGALLSSGLLGLLVPRVGVGENVLVLPVAIDDELGKFGGGDRLHGA